MRKRIIIIMMFPLLMTMCKSTLWNRITKVESRLYTDAEKIMLDEITASVDYRYGFDPDLEIDYVFKAGRYSDKDIQAKAPEMKKVLMKYDTAQILTFYEKVLKMRSDQTWKMNYAQENEDWEDSTFLRKYTLPETELFLDILEKTMIQINPSYGDEIKKRRTIP